MNLIPQRPFCFFISWLLLLPLAVAQEQDPFAKERQRMVKEDLAGRDITDPKILKVMEKVPRHLFVEKKLWRHAYADHPLPIGEGQTISQPYIVALMTQALAIKPGQKVLEIGTGSGYQAAVLSELTDKVFTIEIRKSLADKAAKTLKGLGYTSIKVKYGDGYFGWEENAPFDAIIITCAANHIPPPLLNQLNIGGKLIIPLGSTTYSQTLTLITKKEDGEEVTHITSVAFVPMVGETQNR